MSSPVDPASQPALQAHLRRFRSEFPKIRPYAEEDDGNWWNEGLDALQTNQLNRAERLAERELLLAAGAIHVPR